MKSNAKTVNDYLASLPEDRRTPAKASLENHVRLLATTGRGPDGKKLKSEGKKTAKMVAKKEAKKVAER
jgi:hypothetical protein